MEALRLLWFGVASFLVWIIGCALLQSRDRALGWALACLGGAVGVYYLTAFLIQDQTSRIALLCQRIKWAVTPWMAVAFFSFAGQHLPNGLRHQTKWLRWGSISSSVLSILISATPLFVVDVDAEGLIKAGPLFPILVLFYLFYALAGLWILWKAWKLQGRPLHLTCLLGTVLITAMAQAHYVARIYEKKYPPYHNEFLTLVAALLFLCSLLGDKDLFPNPALLRRSLYLGSGFTLLLWVAYALDFLVISRNGALPFPYFLTLLFLLFLLSAPWWYPWLTESRETIQQGCGRAREQRGGRAERPGDEKETKVEVRVLGGMEIYRDGLPLEHPRWSGKVKALFACLLWRKEKGATRDELIEYLWPNEEPGIGSRRFHTTLHYLRRVLARISQDEVACQVTYRGGRYYLDLNGTVMIDRDKFLSRVKEARRLQDEGHMEEAVRLLEEAEALYQGDFLKGLEDVFPPEELYPQRAMLESAYIEVLRTLALSLIHI